MASSLIGAGGFIFGGEGSFTAAPPPPCQMVIQNDGLIDFLNRLTGYMFGWYRVGLFQNDVYPRITDTISAYTPANFSGYIGPQILYGWSPATMYGRKAKSFANQLSWVYNGGTVTNDIFGYYVTDPTGVLRFAERFCDGPVHMIVKGRKIRLQPQFEALNEGDELQ